MSPLNGVLPVDKPPGPTSHDVVAIARRSLGERRIGHTGTLDPFASGLLLLCLGPSTRLAEFLTALPKSYTAKLHLGVVTETDDVEGAVLESNEGWRGLAAPEIEAVIAAQSGDLLQVPPRYSAKKVAGERMYTLARQGREPTPEPSSVTVHRIAATRIDPPDVEFEVDCSSGTYIRSIARDIGAALGVGAHLTALRRTRIGTFEVDDALALSALDDDAAVRGALVEPARAISHLPAVRLAEADVRRVAHGGRVAAPPEAPPEGIVVLLSATGILVGIGTIGEGRIQPRKVFA
jgi:tRNA pseudouridine55 synthase